MSMSICQQATKLFAVCLVVSFALKVTGKYGRNKRSFPKDGKKAKFANTG